MSINITSNIPSKNTRSLSDQGSFRNSMYQREEEKKNKRSFKESKNSVREDLTNQYVKNDKIKIKSAGLNCEISNIEEEITIAQTVEKALINTEDSLIQMQELVYMIGKEKEFNSNLRNADQVELEQLINRINKISDETTYGKNILLDGSFGVRGVTNGKFLEFVDIRHNSKLTPLSSYEVEVFEVATRSELKGEMLSTQKLIDNSENLIFEVDGMCNRFVFKKGEIVSSALKRLSDWISEREIPLEILANGDQILHFRHKQFGSGHVFGISVLKSGLISKNDTNLIVSEPGKDIKGSINGVPCLGRGQFLSAPKDVDELSELIVRYAGDEVPSIKKVGVVTVSQNSFQFLDGSSYFFVRQLCLKSIHASELGKETENISGFKSLQDIDIKTSQRAKDSLWVIKKSLEEVIAVKEKVELVSGKTLKSNIQNLKQEHDKLVDSKHNIKSIGNARAFAELTKNQITENSSRSNLAQAHQNPDSVLTLLK